MMTEREGKLAGHVALVTGSGRGIGRSIATSFADEGAAVCLTARSEHEIKKVQQVIESRGGQAMAEPCDVANFHEVQQLIERVLQQWERIDILVNNAGGNFKRQPVIESDPEQWKHVVDTNLLGTYYCCRACLPVMAAQGGGKIINVGSGMGHSARAGNSAYNVAKAGMWMLTRVLSAEVWQQGIAVNELIPGPVYTRLTEDYFELGKAPPIADSEFVKKPEDCVPLALFLATQPAQGPTGQSFSLARRPL